MGIFTVVILAMAWIWLVLWALLKLRDLREKPLDGGLPNDEATLILGMFYAVSHGCVAYYKAKKRYPSQISGSKEGAYEGGFIEEKNLPGGGLSLVPMFHIVPSDGMGYGICLFNTSPKMVKDILERVEMSGGRVVLLHYNRDEMKFEPIPIPTLTNVNLILPLPPNPSTK